VAFAPQKHKRRQQLAQQVCESQGGMLNKFVAFAKQTARRNP
jgi:hypothetical protein